MRLAHLTTPKDVTLALKVNEDDDAPVMIEGFQCFDASLLEPIPFETNVQVEPLTLESAQDYFLIDLDPVKLESPHDKDEQTITELLGQCFTPGCNKSISYRGHCKEHGGVRLCSVIGCPKGNQGKRLCISHGGGKRCSFPDCEKSAQSHGLCKAHGGGARCTVSDCDKSSQGGGLCRKHGGGRRCSIPNCTSGAQRANLCAKHGGSRLCRVADCGRTDRGGGLCENHRKGLVCIEATCNRLAIAESPEKLCLRHTRRGC